MPDAQVSYLSTNLSLTCVLGMKSGSAGIRAMISARMIP